MRLSTVTPIRDRMTAISKNRYHGIAAGYRSGLEEVVAEDLKRRGVEAKYEAVKIQYTKPSKPSTYTPDFVIEKEQKCPQCRGRGYCKHITGERDDCSWCGGTGVYKEDLIIETKGRFVTADRQKHLLIKKQHPDLDIRFLFQNSRARISKTSKTTYADWCRKHGFIYADKVIPEEWLK